MDQDQETRLASWEKTMLSEHETPRLRQRAIDRAEAVVAFAYETYTGGREVIIANLPE